MKKTIIYGMVLLLIIGMATAGVLDITNKDLSVNKDQKANLDAIGLTDYTRTDYEIDENTIKVCLQKEGVLNSCKVFHRMKGMNDLAFGRYINDWEQKRIEMIGNDDNDISYTKTKEEVTTIK